MKRLFALVALIVTVSAGLLSGSLALAQGNAQRNDFLALSSKRADLRLNLARKGVDAAFTDWLRVERPAAYRVAVARSESRQQIASRKGNCCVGEKMCERCPTCCTKTPCPPVCCTPNCKV
jgi:hypothetical protein